MKRSILLKTIILHLFLITPAVSNTLGQMTVYLKGSGNRTLTYERVQGYAVVEGDILIGKVSETIHSKKAMIHSIPGSRWQNGIFPFELAEDLPLMTKLAIYEAITLWHQKTTLEFIELTSKNRDSYPDYISFVPAEGTTCASFVGRQQGKQIILLAPRCHTMNTVHEIGHALGLWHEQSRFDRDNYVRIFWENIQEDHQYNFNQHLTDGQDYGDYDYDSIMHYGAYAFSKNGKKTIETLIDGIEIGQRDHLSQKDIDGVNGMYATELMVRPYRDVVH